ncbi:MAG TPA: alpha/beta hydrolase [Campylobacterales bacterium]|nr:alpha/beta hydrolase [Campylobacterales bacterium]
MKKLFLILIPLLFISCANKNPITWDKRVIHSHIKPLNLSYDEYGKKHKETLLFLHGFGESKYTWRFLIKPLSKYYHIITLDLKGFGDSPKTEDEDYSVYDQAKIVQKFIEAKKLKNLTIAGRSFGGGVALVLALMQEKNMLQTKIDRLILMNTMSYKQPLPSMMRVLQKPIIGYLGIHLLSAETIAKEAYAYAFSNDKLIPKDSVEKSAKLIDMPNAKYAYKQTVDYIIPDDIAKIEKEYKDIKIPTLILWGKDDVSIPYIFGKRLHQDIPNSYFSLFKGVGHMPQEEAPQKVIYEIEKFIKKTSRKPRSLRRG